MGEEPTSTRKQEFELQARRKRSNVVAEFWSFLRHNKKWWLLPVIVVLLLLGLIVLMSGTAVAPFIYPVF